MMVMTLMKVMEWRKLMKMRVKRRCGEMIKENQDLDEEPDVALLLLHLWDAAVWWAEAGHGCRAFFNTSTHRGSS